MKNGISEKLKQKVEEEYIHVKTKMNSKTVIIN